MPNGAGTIAVTVYTPRTIGYDRAIDAMNAVDRLIKEEPAPLVTHHTDDGQIVVTRDTSGT